MIWDVIDCFSLKRLDLVILSILSLELAMFCLLGDGSAERLWRCSGRSF